MVQSNSARVLFCVILLLSATFGCNKKVADSADETEIASKSQSNETKTNVVATSNTSGIISPAEKDGNELEIDASPDQVCSAFLNALVAKDYVIAKRLLTRESQFQTQNANLELQAPGSTNATYKVLEPLYATNKKLVAKVDCQITDKLDGKEMTYIVTWVLRLKQSGWKISGMMFQVDENQPMDYLCFENIDDVLRIKNAVDGDTVRTANDPLRNDIK